MNKLLKSGLAGVLAILASAAGFTQTKAPNKAKMKLTQHVDQYIGTGGHGHVFMGANVPFGAVQLGPTNLTEGWDWCSGYHYSDSTIIGFSHTHLSGTGIGDLGDISLMPATGDVKIWKGVLNKPETGYYSLFSHDEEKASPGYYSVRLKRYDIKAELTASNRVGFHQYTFPKADDAKIIIDLQPGIGWDVPTETFIEKLTDTTVAGYRYSRGWATDQRIYFHAIFSKPIKSFTLQDSSAVKEGIALKGRRIKGVANFATSANEVIRVKVGISPVSSENAAANIRAEIPGWDFGQVVSQADAAWNAELQKASIETKDAKTLRKFYTALYHTMIAPSAFNDHNGEYRGTDKKVYKNAGFTNLTTFSLWDTYRAAHPLFTILQPEKVNDMISSMLAIYQQQGKLPIWHLMGNETNTMVGNPTLMVVADAYLKGFTGFDQNLAFEAMKKSAMLDERGLKHIKSLGYIPADSTVESVAIGLENAIADWSVAQVAKKMGKQDDYAYFTKRGQNYRNYYDLKAGFMRGRISQNEWRTPFNPFESVHMKNDFTEGNAWQYTWLVPHDVEGLIQLLGGEKRFTTKLDSLFIAQGDLGKDASPDISGLIGQYAHGNEPSHHITYMYSFVGQPWKTADKVRHIMDSLYTDKFDGLSGNEDVGQMSAWYIFSSMGFYPLNPANGMYIFGSPVVDKATLTVAGGKKFTLTVKNNSENNKYIQRVTFNQKPYTRSYFLHRDLVKGGTMVIEMGPKPSVTWGVNPADRPYSELR